MSSSSYSSTINDNGGNNTNNNVNNNVNNTTNTGKYLLFDILNIIPKIVSIINEQLILNPIKYNNSHNIKKA